MRVAAPSIHRTVHERVFAHANTAEAPFVTVIRQERTATLTYGELAVQSQRYAALYRSKGARPGDAVAIILPQCAELYPAFLGAMSMGAVPAILPARSYRQDPAIFWNAQNTVLQRMRAALILTDAETLPELRDRAPDYGEQAAETSELPAHGWSSAVNIPEDWAALLQHSSGTTGVKKGVELSHRTVLDQIDAYSASIGISGNDRVATWLPHYHDMGLIACFLLPAVAGISIVCLDPFEWVARPTRFLDVIERYGCTIGWQPNFAFHHIARAVGNEARWNLESLRLLIDCSEPCKPETLEAFHTTLSGTGLRREALQVCYAMAENVFAVTQTAISTEPRKILVEQDALRTSCRVVETLSEPCLRFVSCGAPIESARVSIRADDDAVLPENSVGRIAIGGKTLFTGYHRGPPRHETADGWYLTGDLGFLNKGELFVVGRSEDVIIVNGRNMYAHEIEQVVNVHTSVKAGRCVALGIYNSQKGSEELVLVVETPNGETDADLRRRIGEVVASATGVLIHSVRFVPPGWLLKTTSGKINRRANLARYEAESASS